MSGHRGVQGLETSAGERWLPIAPTCRVIGGTTEVTVMLVMAGVTIAGGVIEVSACE